MLLTLDEAKGLITTTLSDDSLTLLLGAAEEAIDEVLGPRWPGAYADEMAPVVEGHRPHGPLLQLARRAATIDLVTEGTTDLTASDYELRPGARILKRVTTEGDPTSWRGRVEVQYTPLSNVAERKVMQSELVRLNISFNPGLASQTIGPWTESYTGSGRPYGEQRAEILSSTPPSSVGFW